VGLNKLGQFNPEIYDKAPRSDEEGYVERSARLGEGASKSESGATGWLRS
jgi:hypothetical protein